MGIRRSSIDDARETTVLVYHAIPSDLYYCLIEMQFDR